MTQLELQYEYMRNRGEMAQICRQNETATYEFWDLFYRQY